jgi:hypothetical protein
MAKSSKLPALQFYPGDWKKDLGIQSLDYESRGIWFELLLIMHESERRGFLQLNEAPMSDQTIGKILGIHGNKWKKTLRKLEVTGVISRDKNTGILYSRRMVRDEEFRQKRIDCGQLGAEFGVLGGRPKNPTTGGVKERVKNPPSSSSSSSSSILDTKVSNIYISDLENAPEEPPQKPKSKKPKSWPPAGDEIKQHVFLTEEQRLSLYDHMCMTELNYWCTELSDYANENLVRWKKKYKDHSKVILKWRRMKLEKGYIWNKAAEMYRFPERKPSSNFKTSAQQNFDITMNSVETILKEAQDKGEL